MKVEMYLSPNGFGSYVKVDGVNIAKSLIGATLEAKAGRPPRLVLDVLIREGLDLTAEVTEVLKRVRTIESRSVLTQAEEPRGTFPPPPPAGAEHDFRMAPTRISARFADGFWTVYEALPGGRRIDLCVCANWSVAYRAGMREVAKREPPPAGFAPEAES